MGSEARAVGRWDVRAAKVPRVGVLVTVGLVAVAACGGEAGSGGERSTTDGGGPPSGEERVDPPRGGAGGAAEEPLYRPGSPDLTETAPDSFRVRFETSRGAFLVEVRRGWAPRGADRFYNLVEHGFYDGARFFRVIDGFVAQFGLAADPELSRLWRRAVMPDDSVRRSNLRGHVSFASAGPGTRTTQLFINLRDNSRLDSMGFAPIGRVVEGMSVVDGLYDGYGERPRQGEILRRGEAYLAEEFPELDVIERAEIVTE